MTPPDGYRYHTPIMLRYGDMDTLGHVNNAKYLTYLEQARVSYFRDMQLWDGQLSNLGAIIAKITIEYRLPLTMADGTVDVWTRCSRLGNKSFEFEQLITCTRDSAMLTAAYATTVVVTFDYSANTSVVVPERWRSLIVAYEPALGA